MKIPKIALNNYHFTLVFFIMVTLWGISSYMFMPKSEDPYTEFHTTTILVVNPGATPEDMETLVVNPIEESVNQIEGIKNINTSIMDGVSFLFIEYFIGEDYDKIHQEITQKINKLQAELPSSIARIEIEQPSVLGVSIYQLAFVSEGASDEELRLSAKKLKKRIEKLSGIRKVTIEANQDYQVQVACNMERLAAYNIPLNQVLYKIQSENMSIPGGSVDLGNRKFNIQTSGLYKNIDELKQTIIHAGQNGVIRLSDVAEVSYGYKKPEALAHYNGKPALWLAVQQKKGENIYSLSEQIDAVINEYKTTLPQNISIQTVLRQADGVKNRVSGFFMNFLQGIILVGAIVLIALGFRSAVIVMIAIPVSVFAAIGMLDMNGFGIQQMSIAGLIIALGMLVDNSIAMVENIYRYINKGLKPVDAALKGASEIGVALISSTVTTLLAFAPMLMMNNDVSNFIKSMILVVIYALSASLVVALCLTPFVASRLLSKKKSESKPGLMQRWVDGPYARLVTAALKRPKTVITISILVFIGSVSLMPLIGVSFFPKAEKSQLMINVHGIEGTNLDNTQKAIDYVEQTIKKVPEVEKIASTAGESNPQVYYNMMKLSPAVNTGQVYVILTELVQERMDEIIRELRQTFNTYPGAKIEVKEFVQGPPVDAPIQLRLFSDNLEDLKTAATMVEEVYMQTPGVININNPLSVNKTDLQVKINREKAGALGVSIIETDRMVRAAVTGLNISTYQNRLGEKYDIVVQSNEDNTKDLSWMDKVFIPTATGGQVKLGQIADIVMVQGHKRIDHYDLDRYVSVLADVDETVQSIDQATREVLGKVNALELPQGVTIGVGGEQESREESFGGLGQSFLIALLAIFGVLVLQFKSFKQPLIIFTAIPLSITGSFVTLLIVGYSFSFMAFVGLTSLMGIVINSSIILVDYANKQLENGLSVYGAVIKAAKTRFTPIVLTTLTTVFGLLPLTLFGGTMWGPMGWAIIGGLIFSTLLTLILVPVLYLKLSNNKK